MSLSTEIDYPPAVPMPPEAPYTPAYCRTAMEACDLLAAKASSQEDRVRWRDASAMWSERLDSAVAGRVHVQAL